MRYPANNGLRFGILTRIEEVIAAEQRPPTYEELRAHFGVNSCGTIQYHIAWLKRRGYLANRGGARGLAVLISAPASV